MAAGPVRASTTIAVAAVAKGTCHFTPSSTKPSPSEVAVACTPRGPKPLPGSSHAVVTIASPLTMRGSHARFCSSVPARSSTPALITALTKCGVGASARPSSM